MVTPINHIIARAGLKLRGVLGTLEIFATSFCQMQVTDYQKKYHHLRAGLLAGSVLYYGKSGFSYCITLIKRLDENSQFLPKYTSKLVGKN